LVIIIYFYAFGGRAFVDGTEGGGRATRVRKKKPYRYLDRVVFFCRGTVGRAIVSYTKTKVEEKKERMGFLHRGAFLFIVTCFSFGAGTLPFAVWDYYLNFHYDFS